MNAYLPSAGNRAPGKWFFLGAFVFSCILFWWLPSILYRVVVGQADAVEDATVVLSLFALLCFIIGYLLPVLGESRILFTETILDACESFAYWFTVFLFLPSLLICIYLLRSHINQEYGDGAPIPTVFQAVLYTHLFFGFLFLGTTEPEKRGWRRPLMVVAVVTLPRLIESMHGGRFFLAQAVVPAVLIGVARGWIRFSVKRMAQIALIAVFIIFVPSITRGDDLMGEGDTVKFFAAGSSLQLFQDNMDLDMNGRCESLLVSLTAKTIPYGLMNLCVMDFAGLKNMPATAGRIITVNAPSSFEGTAAGTGSNFLLELYLLGGIPAVMAGTAVFGFSCRRFLSWIGRRSLFAGIWAECLTRALFAPRGELGYVYERIPSLIAATLFVVLIVCAGRFLIRESAANPDAEAVA